MFIIFFIIGAFVGSFLNVVILRLYKGEQFVSGRSKCIHCKKTLKILDLIPIFSFLFLRGKCRYCKKRLSIQYPLIEFATGALFAILLINYKLQIINYDFLFLGFLGSSLIILFVYDLRYKLVPHEIIWPTVTGSILYKILPVITNHKLLITNFLYFELLSAIIAASFIAFIVFITRGRGMGIGDIPLAFIVVLLPSFPNGLFVFWLSFIIGGVAGIILLLLRKAKLKTEVPFGPFLIGSLGVVAVLQLFNVNLFWWSIF